MKRLSLAVAAVLVATVVAAAEVASNRFESATAGFRVDKPAEWRFVSMEQVAKNRAGVRLKDEDLQKLIQQQASTPLVVMMKHQEPFNGLNPTFQVTLRPLPPSLATATPKQILELVIPALEKGFADFKLTAPVHEFTFSGHPAAESIATYKVRSQEGGEFPTKGRMIIVPRGQLMFLIGASAPPEGPDSSEAEFEAILKSVVISD
jgi:hypothetical protein